MNGYVVAAVLVSIFAIVTYIPYRIMFVNRVQRVIQKYPLFGVRDELVRLRIEGYFNSDLRLYDYYCGLCNEMILHTKELNLELFLVAVRHLTSESNSAIERRRQRLERAPEQVRCAVDHLYEAVQGILRQNSTLLRVLLKAPQSAREKSLAWVSTAAKPVNSSSLLVVREYREVAETRSTLRLSPSYS